jgi:hypothetical protein
VVIAKPSQLAYSSLQTKFEASAAQILLFAWPIILTWDVKLDSLPNFTALCVLSKK